MNVAVPLSIRQVAVQAGLSHASAGEALDHLVSLGVVASSDAGRSRIHWLERRGLAVRQMVLPVFQAEAAAAHSAIEALVAGLPTTVYAAVLFGSRARGENALNSDYDVVVVEPNRSPWNARWPRSILLPPTCGQRSVRRCQCWAIRLIRHWNLWREQTTS